MPEKRAMYPPQTLKGQGALLGTSACQRPFSHALCTRRCHFSTPASFLPPSLPLHIASLLGKHSSTGGR